MARVVFFRLAAIGEKAREIVKADNGGALNDLNATRCYEWLAHIHHWYLASWIEVLAVDKNSVGLSGRPDYPVLLAGPNSE